MTLISTFTTSFRSSNFFVWSPPVVFVWEQTVHEHALVCVGDCFYVLSFNLLEWDVMLVLLSSWWSSLNCSCKSFPQLLSLGVFIHKELPASYSSSQIECCYLSLSCSGLVIVNSLSLWGPCAPSEASWCMSVRIDYIFFLDLGN